MGSLEKAYLDGIVLAHSWMTKAEIEGHVEAAEAFRRILEDAKQKYYKIFKTDESCHE